MTKAASLLKKVVDRADVLTDGALSTRRSKLAGRTAESELGCAAVTPKAKLLFDAYAKSLGLSSLEFRNPAAPDMPGP